MHYRRWVGLNFGGKKCYVIYGQPHSFKAKSMSMSQYQPKVLITQQGRVREGHISTSGDTETT